MCFANQIGYNHQNDNLNDVNFTQRECLTLTIYHLQKWTHSRLDDFFKGIKNEQKNNGQHLLKDVKST